VDLEKFLTYTVIGLSLSAIYAVIGSGLVLTYTTTGIFNFAHGAIGMVAAFAYWQMRFEWGWSAPVSVFLVLCVLAPLFGVLLETVVMRGLQDTSEATKLVVSISLLVALIALANWIWEPDVSRPMAKFFGGERLFDVANTTITKHDAITIGVAIAVAIGLRFLLYVTRIGVAMRAAVDDRPLSTLNGARPDQVSMFAWALGCMLAALGGILIAPGAGLEAGLLSLVIVNAYAAAIFGRLRSLPLTFLGAVVIGCAEGYLLGYTPASSYLTGLRLAAPAIILLLVLLALPNPRLRGRVRSREYFPMPSWSGALAFAGLVTAFGLVLATTLSKPDAAVYGKIFPVAIIALSLVPLAGYAGQISLCQLSFAGVGAVAMAHLGTGGSAASMRGLVTAVVLSAIVGALVALPALRLSGIYLALGTAAFAVALDRWVWNLPDFEVFGRFTVSLFETGSASVEPVQLLGYSFDTPARNLMLVSTTFALLSLLVVAIRRSQFGRRLLAMKGSEAACATLGLNLLGTKVAVFAVSAGMAGLGGALIAAQAGSIQAQQFSFVNGLPIFMLAVIGGIGAVGGAYFAGVSLEGMLALIAKLGGFFSNLAGVLPGLAGIGLGRNPNGAVHDMREGFMPAWQNKRLFALILGGFAVVYALRLADVLTNWPFVVASLAWVVGMLLVGAARGREARPERVEGIPLEWFGVDAPWSHEEIEEVERELGVHGVEMHGAA
jgi:branched-chain amino acid transport system permease protein